MKIRTAVLVNCSGEIQDFALQGVVKPVILVPAASAAALTPAELEAVLVHELCHLQRRDILCAVVVHGLTCLFWFHPALWWIERQLLLERERACDEAVQDFGCSAESYASGILKACRLPFQDLHPGTCAVSSVGLQGRIEQILSYIPQQKRKSTKLVTSTLYSAVTAAAFLLGFLQSPLLNAASDSRVPPEHNAVISCVFADRPYREGTIIQQETGGEQMCVVAYGKPLWVRTSPQTRQQSQSVITIPKPGPAFCKPTRSGLKVNCTCEGAAFFSPGSRVNSPAGILTCSAGVWVRAIKDAH